QNLGMTAQQLAMQSGQYAAGLDLQAQNAQAQLQLQQQAQNLPYLQFMGSQNAQIGNWMQQGFANQMAGNAAMQQAGAMQQTYDQAAADRAYQYWQSQQNFPYQEIDWLSNLATKLPAQGTVQQNTSGTQTTSQPTPSIWNTIAGGLATG